MNIEPEQARTNENLEEGLRIFSRVSSELCLEVETELRKWKTDEIRGELEQLFGSEEKRIPGELSIVMKMNADYRMLNGKDHPGFDNYFKNINSIQRRLLDELKFRENIAREILAGSYE